MGRKSINPNKSIYQERREELGLSREKAIKYAECTMRGAAELALASGKEPEQLKREVCSPGGSTIEGVKKFEEGCLKECAINAVKAPFKRNKELGN